MGGPGMMGWHGMGSYYSRLTPEQLKQRQYMMDQYLGMQQQMMNHMLFQQNYMWVGKGQVMPAFPCGEGRSAGR